MSSGNCPANVVTYRCLYYIRVPVVHGTEDRDLVLIQTIIILVRIYCISAFISSDNICRWGAIWTIQ